MQKISSYLYSNRVAINLDLASSPLEWRIVYQRKVKIYKGYDNIITLDIKNSDQKRINVSDLTLQCVIMDHAGQEVYTAGVIHSDTPGLATFNVPSLAVDSIAPQFLRYAVYVLNDDDTKNVIYGDTQFGVTGFMDLIGDATITGVSPKTIKTFTYEIDVRDPTWATRNYHSEAIEINPVNDGVGSGEVELEFMFSSLAADVTVQTTKDGVVSTATTWANVETFNVTSATTTVTKTYPTSADTNWLRITYIAQANATGKIDKVTARL
jgi:hypothetical protein